MTNQKKAFAATIGCLLFMICRFYFRPILSYHHPTFLYQRYYHRWIQTNIGRLERIVE